MPQADKIVRKLPIFSLMLVCILSGRTLSAGPGGQTFALKAKPSLLTSHGSIHPGMEFQVGLRFDIEKEWHIYWRNPGDSGLAPKATWKLPAGFTVSELRFPVPERYVDLGGFTTNILEGTPTLLATVKAPDDLKVGRSVELSADLQWLVCKNACIMETTKVSKVLEVVPAGQTLSPADADALKSAARFLPKTGGKGTYVSVAAAAPEQGWAPGGTGKLVLDVQIKSGMHIQSNKPLGEYFVAADVFVGPVEGVSFGKAEFPEPKIRTHKTLGKLSEFAHKIQVGLPAKINADFEGDKMSVSGIFVYQACEDRTGRCYPPESVEWSASVPVDRKSASATPAVQTPVASADATPSMQADTPDAPVASLGGFDIDAAIEIEETSNQWPWYLYFLAGLLGGLILNVMPCVLPVLSIKVLSFVQQAGEDPRRVLHLNLAFAAGLIVVFEILATLAVVGNLGWGGLFGSVVFDVVMASLVFAFGLSLFGVFEIPIPGFVSTAGTSGAVEREGLFGAFLKGVFATLLATPCSGPFLGATFGWSVRQPPVVTYLIWGTIGLGMALPYLILGFKPKWISFLPRPGAWMETFKQAMGFLLMGTTVYFLYVLPDVYAVWTIAFCCFIGLGCWMYGRFNTLSSSSARRVFVNVVSVLVIAVGGWLCFGKLLPVAELRADINFSRKVQAEVQKNLVGTNGQVAEPEIKHPENALPWEPYTLARLQEASEAGHTVMVDFTADWCPNCKVNEAIALNTKGTKKLVDEYGIVCLLADYTRRPEYITQMLNKLNSISIPLTAIFPAGRSNAPLVLRDTFLESTLHEKIRQAGPSKGMQIAGAQ